MVATADLMGTHSLERADLEGSEAVLVQDVARPTAHAMTMAATEIQKAYARVAPSKAVTVAGD
jgi:hypothetical protein